MKPTASTMSKPAPKRRNVKGMSIWAVSLEVANWVYTVAYVALIVGAVLTAVATMSLFWASAVRDQNANLAIAVAQRVGNEAQAEAAKANERAARLELDAAAAKLELEKIKAPRAVSASDADTIEKALLPFHNQKFKVVTYWDSKEPLAFANVLHDILQKGGWQFVPPTTPSWMFGGVEGVQVWIDIQADASTRNAGMALLAAFKSANILALQKDKNAGPEEADVINLSVGAKP